MPFCESYFTLTDAQAEKIVLTAIRKYATKARVGHGIPITPLPEWAPKMELHKANVYGMDAYEPLCNGEILSVSAQDTDMLKYGEMTMSKACLFKYQGGYRLNYYAAFMQRTGGSNINVLGAGLGRLFTKAIGLGDSSKFIKSTMDGFEKRFAEAQAEIQLVELFPSMEGKTVVADQAPVRPPSTPATYQAHPPSLGMNANMPSNLQAMVNTALVDNPELQAQLNAVRQAQMAALQARMGKPVEPQEAPSLKARKELNAMGLTYHDHDQFIAAVRRGDTLAVRLFVQAEGIDLTANDKTGKSALDYAKKPEVVEILRNSAEGREGA